VNFSPAGEYDLLAIVITIYSRSVYLQNAVVAFLIVTLIAEIAVDILDEFNELIGKVFTGGIDSFDSIGKVYLFCGCIRPKNQDW